MLQLLLQRDVKKKAHSISKQSNKFQQELGIHGKTNETASCTRQAKEIKRKAKDEGIKRINKPGKTNPYMADIPNGINKLMFIKQTLISGYVSVCLKGCTRPLHQELSTINCLTIMIRQ